MAKQVAEREIQNRAERIHQLINELDKIMADYRNNYEESSLTEKELKGLSKLKSETKTAQSSITKTNSREK